MGLLYRNPVAKKLGLDPRSSSAKEVEPAGVVVPRLLVLALNDERRKIVARSSTVPRPRDVCAAPRSGTRGQGFGAVNLTLINEILAAAPVPLSWFGTRAPDTGQRGYHPLSAPQARRTATCRGCCPGESSPSSRMNRAAGGADPRVSPPVPSATAPTVYHGRSISPSRIRRLPSSSSGDHQSLTYGGSRRVDIPDPGRHTASSRGDAPSWSGLRPSRAGPFADPLRRLAGAVQCKMLGEPARLPILQPVLPVPLQSREH